VSRHDDELDGDELLSPRQRAAVARLRGRQHRHTGDRVTPTTRELYEDFNQAEEANERDYWKHS
jgi:hypothetical protein